MSTRPQILVTGSNGQLGKELKLLAPRYPQFDFIFLSREDLPIHHFEMVRHYFNTYHPQFLVNCAAYTAVDRAEQEKDLAMQVNAEAVGVLAAICKENQCKFVHVSTDYVFDGLANKPYLETDVPNPQSVYGKSKLVGEKQALQFNPESILIRTSWVYSEFGKNFVKTMIKLMKEKNELHVVYDQIGSPTYAGDLAEIILQVIFKFQFSNCNWTPGIYHFSNKGNISWYDFAVAIGEMIKSDCKIRPIPTSQYPTPAARPAFSVLDTSKIEKTFGLKMKNWKDSLVKCLEKLK